MQVEVIKTKAQYEKSLQRFEALFFVKSDTKEGKEAQLLALVIKDYEERHFKIDVQD